MSNIDMLQDLTWGVNELVMIECSKARLDLHVIR